MFCTVLVDLPVQTEFGFVVNLGTVHTEVMLAVRVLGDHKRQGDEMTAVHGPCFGDGEFGQVVGQTNTLALAFADLLRRHGQGVS